MVRRLKGMVEDGDWSRQHKALVRALEQYLRILDLLRQLRSFQNLRQRRTKRRLGRSIRG